MINEKEQNEINQRFTQLKEVCRNCAPEDIQKLENAFQLAVSLYNEKRKPSGEPLILHSLSVAIIVADEIGLRAGSVIASLFHDIIHSPDENIDQVGKQFGNDVAAIVRGFKKLSGFHSDKVKLQSENFRSLFLSMIDDVRIIFIKMAHRLHDLRNYETLPDELKKAFLNDVQYLYIPIAHRMGLYQIKAQLEDLALRYTHPVEYAMIESRLNETRQQQDEYIQKFIHPVVEQLDNANLKYEIKSRAKSISSIKKKLETQNVQLEQVYDLFAIRVILTGILTKQDEDFIESFKNELESSGDPRNVRRSRKSRQKEELVHGNGVKKTALGENADDQAILDEIRTQEIQKFECRRKRYLELLNREKTACWQTYSIITNIYPPNPKRLRDWITTPKDSGYESLHTTVLGPDDRWVEVQIRTVRMDEEAEKGSAAHWKYKESAYGRNVDHWMVDVRNILETIGTQRLDEQQPARIDVQSGSIYVFTPTGDLRELKNGATILDFAFEIHTDVGCKCIGGKINGKIFPIRHVLKNGDQVEILTAKNQRPHSDWLNVVVTSKARNRIARSLREEKYKEAEVGKDMLYRKFKNWKIELNDRELIKILKYFNFKKPVDLYYHIATEKIDVQEIKLLFKTTEEIEEKSEKAEKPFDFEELIESQSEKDQGYITIESGVTNLNYSLSKCCNPIAGDRIFGFVTVNQGIKIHRYTCPNAEQMLKRFPYRIIKARWKEMNSMKFFITNLRVVGMDRVGLINDITKAISEDLKVNMKSINFKSLGSSFEGLIKVQVRDVEHLGYLRQKLLKIKGVVKVGRFD
ncbi:MAG: bifunctional (p)ppGpp synthetase/guanosine-3',5'-bis(diphosphate) 3'-pyrophosphohydrolase [Bacteroidales bacterium]|nr:bifunctional (p)ppGpp synthetase/guanosine-3',5'-bis(diphosphate) 3'-pyrophosphohydrolase [Bacteroidales bacterium]